MGETFIDAPDQTLVEQATARIDTELRSRFARIAEQSYKVGTTASLLQSEEYPTIFAAYALGMLAMRGIRPTIPKVKNVAKNQRFSPQDILELNHHPFIRTHNAAELGYKFEARAGSIVQVVKQLELVPIAWPIKETPPTSGSEQFYHTGYYDLDQAHAIREGIQTLPPAEGFISVKSVLEDFRISHKNFETIQRILKFNTELFYNEESQSREPYVYHQTLPEIRLIIQTAITQGRRRRQAVKHAHAHRGLAQ